MRKPFRFKQFSVVDTHSALKTGTDAVLLGSWCDVAGVESILDIGTGNGIIALILAQRTKVAIVGIDNHPGSIEDALQNFQNSPWSNRLNAQLNSFEDYLLTTKQKFDLIVSNPPFFANDLHPENLLKKQSKHQQQLTYHNILRNGKNLLNPHGRIALIAPQNANNNIQKMARDSELYLHRKLSILPKKSKPANRVLLEFSLITPEGNSEGELIIRNADNTFTQKYQKLTCDFYLDF